MMEEDHVKELEMDKPLRMNSRCKYRYSTDRVFKFLPALALMVWLLIVNPVIIQSMKRENMFVRYIGRRPPQFDSLKRWLLSRSIFDFVYTTAERTVFPNNSRQYLYTGIGMILALISVAIFLTILRFKSKFSIWLGSFSIFISSIYQIICIINPWWFSYRDIAEFLPTVDIIEINARMIPIIPYFIVQIMLYIAGLVCLRKTGITAISTIVEKIGRALRSFSYLTTFGLIVLILQIFFLLFTISIINDSDTSSFACYVASLAAFYVVTFIHVCVKMIISLTISTSYSVQDTSEISKTLLFKSINTVIRYHLGTAALAALPFLPFFMTLSVALEQKFNKLKKDVNSIMNVILITYLTFNITDYSTCLTSIHGENFIKSTSTAFRILTKKSMRSLAFICIFYNLISAGIMMMIVSSQIPVFATYSRGSSGWKVVGNYAIILTLSIFLLLDVFGHVYLLYSSDDDENEDDIALQEDTTQATPIVIVEGKSDCIPTTLP